MLMEVVLVAKGAASLILSSRTTFRLLYNCVYDLDVQLLYLFLTSRWNQQNHFSYHII